MGHSFDEFHTGQVVYGPGKDYFRVRARRLHGSVHSPAIYLETIEGEYRGEFTPEALAIPAPAAGVHWPAGYELPARFAKRIGEVHRAAFLNFLKEMRSISWLRRPYGKLVLQNELIDALRRFNDARDAAQHNGNGKDQHQNGGRRFCVGCGKKGRFSQRADGTPAHASCNENLKTAAIHYCTYCGISFERCDYSHLKLMYWRRVFICPVGSHTRNGDRLISL